VEAVVYFSSPATRASASVLWARKHATWKTDSTARTPMRPSSTKVENHDEPFIPRLLSDHTKEACNLAYRRSYIDRISAAKGNAFQARDIRRSGREFRKATCPESR
jgi:hypothetical protein